MNAFTPELRYPYSMKYLVLFLLILCWSEQSFAADQLPTIRCGVASGYPPYQYSDKAGKPIGIDVEIAKLVFKEVKKNILFIQGEWENLLSNLIFKTNSIDMLCGAEITDKRKALLDFSDPFYSRHIVLFTLKTSPIKSITDLYGKIIAGDKDSFFETYLGPRKEEIRVMRTKTKEDSFIKLKEGAVVAVIAPLEVGYFMAHKLGIQVKTIVEKDPGSPVAFAVSKGNPELLKLINQALLKLKREKKIEKILLKKGIE